jgi:hypothetical protein
MSCTECGDLACLNGIILHKYTCSRRSKCEECGDLACLNGIILHQASCSHSLITQPTSIISPYSSSHITIDSTSLDAYKKDLKKRGLRIPTPLRTNWSDSESGPDADDGFQYTGDDVD